MEVKCPVCGAPMENDNCGYCGYVVKKPAQTMDTVDTIATQPQVIQPQIVINNPVLNNTGIIPGISRKSKWVAFFLCVFLGCFGVHKIYVGKVGIGVLYLLTMGLCGFGWIIDIILIATGSFKDEFGLPLRQ